MRHVWLGAIVWLTLFGVARGHFLWLAPDLEGRTPRVRVYFGETAAPDDPALLDKVASAEAWAVGERGDARPVKLQRDGQVLFGELEQPATTFLRHAYGVVSKGGETFQLRYYAKAYPFALPGAWRAVGDAERLPLEITPSSRDGAVRLVVTWRGEKAAGTTVTIAGPGIEGSLEGKTDGDGAYTVRLARPGTYSIRAKHVENASGKSGEQAYASVRHYSTLTLNFVPPSVAPTAHELPPLPRGTTSFGGATLGETLYVYGGNYGSAHEYSREHQSSDLWSLDLRKPGAWKLETSGAGPRLQGLAMVAHGEHLYRIGGFSALNAEGEEQDFRSQSDFARWKPGSDAWENLPALPEARSSHDAVVVGDTLYVVGGWRLQGKSAAATWHRTALACRLDAPRLEWKPIAAPPFERRALALAAWRGKVYCLGGMRSKGGPTTAVDVYDPARDAWTEGPALQGVGMEGFGASAFACRDSLFVTTVSGSIQRLADPDKNWECVGQLAEPRFFHRLLPWQGERLLVVGGADMTEGKKTKLELLMPGAETARP